MKFLGPEFISGRTGSSGADMATTAIPLFRRTGCVTSAPAPAPVLAWRMEDGRRPRGSFFFSSGSRGLSHSSTGKSRLLECSLFEVTCCLVHYYIDNIFFPRRSRGSTIVLLKDASIRLVRLVVHGQGAVPLVEQAQGKYRFQMLMEHMSIPEWQCRPSVTTEKGSLPIILVGQIPHVLLAA